MTRLTDQIQALLGGDAVEQLGSQLGVDGNTFSTVTLTALPLMVGALSHNTRDQHGAESLASALHEHDGGVFDHPDAIPTDSLENEKILGHLFGSWRGAVEQEVERTTGADRESINKVLLTLAPIVMGWLGREQREANLDPHGLGEFIQNEHAENQRQDTGGLLGRFSALLEGRANLE